MDNKLIYTRYGKRYEIEMYKTTYDSNGNLAVIGLEAKTRELFGNITVNIGELPKGTACLDTNNLPGIFEALLKAGFVHDTGFEMRSGFCKYPVVLFELDRIPDYQEH